MSELLSDRLERVERALRDLEGTNRQLAGLLTQAIKSGAVGMGAAREPVAQEPARKSPPSAAASILGALTQVDPAKTRPPWEAPHQGLGQRLKEFADRQAQENAELHGRPSPSPSP